MAKQQKKVNKGPFIKNANLIGKGGGQVKPVDDSFVKGLKAVKQKTQPKNPSPKVKEHIKTEPAKKNPGNLPARRRQLGMEKAKTIGKIAPNPKPVVKKPPIIPKQKGKVITKKAPSKAAVSAIKKVSKQQVSPKKTTPVKAKKGPVKGR